MAGNNPLEDNAIGNLAIRKEVEEYLKLKLPGVIGLLARKINIFQVLAESGNIGDIDIDKIILGEAKIGKLILEGTSATVHSGSAFLQNVKILLELKLSLDWWVDVWVYDDSGTENLGSLTFPIPVGNVQVPSLQNIDLTIPSMSVENLTANISPINNLDLGGGSFSKLDAKETTVPLDGFQLSGLGLGNLSLSSAQVPQTFTKEAKIQQFKPNADLVLPEANVSQLNVPPATANSIQSGSISLDGIATKRGVGANFGIFGVTFWVQPVAHIGIGSMVLQGVKLSAQVNRAKIENVSIPIDIRGVALKSIDIKGIDVNNVTL